MTVCYVALGFTTEALNGKEIHTPTMTALFEVHDHSPYSPLPTEYTMSKLIEYRGKGA